MHEPPRKKILFLITKSNYGGAQRYVFDLATGLPREQFETVVACGGDGPLITKLHDAGVRVVPIGALQRDISLAKELAATREMARIIKAERPDVLHVNSSKAGLFGAFLGQILRVPRVIFTAHGWAFNEDRGALSKTLIKTLHYITVLLSDTTIAVSDAIKTQMDWPFAGRKMTVIRHGHDAEDHMTKDEARDALIKIAPTLTSHKDDPWTVTIAELHPVKRHDVMIHAMRELVAQYPNLRHIIMGAGELREELAALIAAEGLKKHVFLLGHVADAASYLPAFDIFALTSRSEALAYVLLEAGAVGLPVVATHVGGIPEIIAHEKTGLLVPHADVPATTAALATLLSNQDLHAKLATSLKEKVTHDFSLERMLKETEATYSRK